MSVNKTGCRSLGCLGSLPLPPSNKESLGHITPLHVVVLGPIFPTMLMIWEHMKGFFLQLKIRKKIQIQIE
jgi:hypothetical protein